MERTLAWQGFTQTVNRPYFLSPVASSSASTNRKAMSWMTFSLSPKAGCCSGRTVPLRKGRECETITGGANVDVPPHEGHLFSPSIYSIQEETILCHCMMSVKEKGILLIESGWQTNIWGRYQVRHLRVFPQVSIDPDVNRTMNLVWVLTSITDVMWMCQW